MNKKVITKSLKQMLVAWVIATALTGCCMFGSKTCCDKTDCCCKKPCACCCAEKCCGKKSTDANTSMTIGVGTDGVNMGGKANVGTHGVSAGAGGGLH